MAVISNYVPSLITALFMLLISDTCAAILGFKYHDAIPGSSNTGQELDYIMEYVPPIIQSDQNTDSSKDHNSTQGSIDTVQQLDYGYQPKSIHEAQMRLVYNNHEADSTIQKAQLYLVDNKPKNINKIFPLEYVHPNMQNIPNENSLEDYEAQLTINEAQLHLVNNNPDNLNINSYLDYDSLNIQSDPNVDSSDFFFDEQLHLAYNHPNFMETDFHLKYIPPEGNVGNKEHQEYIPPDFQSDPNGYSESEYYQQIIQKSPYLDSEAEDDWDSDNHPKYIDHEALLQLVNSDPHIFESKFHHVHEYVPPISQNDLYVDSETEVEVKGGNNQERTDYGSAI